MRVLVLDNDRSMREMLGRALSMMDLEPVAAESVAAAEAAIDGCDALLLDYQLSEGATGALLARRWRVEGRLPPFWLVTGMPEDPEVQELGRMEECREVVGKPFLVLGLAGAVRDTLRMLAPSNGGSSSGEPVPETASGGSGIPGEPEAVERPQAVSTQEDADGYCHWKGPVSV